MLIAPANFPNLHHKANAQSMNSDATRGVKGIYREHTRKNIWIEAERK